MFQFEAVVEGQDILLKYACTAHICVHVQGSTICFLEEEDPLVFGWVYSSLSTMFCTRSV